MITEEAFMDIMALHRQGHSMRFIAKKLGMHRNTVKKFILGKRFPEYHRSEGRGCILAPFVRVIQDWLGQDDYRASWVFDRLKPIGYEGSYETVKKFIQPIIEQQARIAYARFETMPGLTGPGGLGRLSDRRVHSGVGLLPGDLCRVRQPLHLGELPGRAYPRVSLPGRGSRRAAPPLPTGTKRIVGDLYSG